MTLSIRKVTDLESWDLELASSPQRNIFCRSDFLEALGCTYDLYFIEENGRLLLGCPIITNASGIPLDHTHPFTQYQGPWFTKAFQALSSHSRSGECLKILDFLLAQLEQNYAQLHFDSHWSFPDLRSFSWFQYGEPEAKRFRMDLYYSGLIDLNPLKDFSEYLTTVRKSRRQEYRALKEDGLAIERSSREKISNFMMLYKATFERQSLSVPDTNLKLVQSILEKFIGTKSGELYFCLNSEKKEISASFFLRDGITSYYLFGANDPDFRHLPGGSLVVLAEIENAFHDGIKCIDMCGMNSPQRGAFKASFNAALVPYFSLTWKK